MSAIFLSASVPIAGRGHYFETADPFLIQCAVRELVAAVISDHRIIWGGHPSITPMIWAICEDLGVEYAKSVTLYMSKFFAGKYPEESTRFDNVEFVDAVSGDLKASLHAMRMAMLSREDLTAAVFIGGMDGVEDEFQIFSKLHPKCPILPVAASGGAALDLAEKLGLTEPAWRGVNFAHLFRKQFLPNVDKVSKLSMS